jgi:hypothetical protein
MSSDQAPAEYDAPVDASVLVEHASDLFPVAPTDTEVVPPFRAAWDSLKVAEGAWSRALQAHLDATSPLGLADRLEATQRAAEQCAAAAKRAADAGLHFQPLNGPAAEDVLPGELHESQRPKHPDGWPGLELAAQVLAKAFRQDPDKIPPARRQGDGDPTLRGIAEALSFMAESIGYLVGQLRNPR